MFVIYDKEIPTVIYGITSTREKAEKAKERLIEIAMADIIATNPTESGIRWDDWSEDQKAALWRETAETISFTEMKVNTIESFEGEEFYV